VKETRRREKSRILTDEDVKGNDRGVAEKGAVIENRPSEGPPVGINTEDIAKTPRPIRRPASSSSTEGE